MNILFYDVTAPAKYDDMTRQQSGLGGTEATVTRVAHGLQQLGHLVAVTQHCRKPDEDMVSNGVSYLSLETAASLTPNIVVLLRSRHWLERVATLFPRARKFFWLHDMPARSLFDAGKILLKHEYEIIAVSNFHRSRIRQRIHGKWYQRLLNFNFVNRHVVVHTIYNPIDNSLQKNNHAWKPRQMILASAPGKGLEYTLRSFIALNKIYPEYKLIIASYAQWDKSKKLPENVEFIGSLPHHELMQRVRESFCMFYPQTHYPETFGLVYAEANAVGTPVLAHDLGAASEILSDPCQLVDARNDQNVIDKIAEWRVNRPNISAKEAFRLEKVTGEWEKLFNIAGKLA